MVYWLLPSLRRVQAHEVRAERTLSKRLLCARHRAVCYTTVNPFNSHDDPRSTGLFKQTHLDDGGPSALGQTTHSRERSAENERAVQQKLSGVSCVTTTCLQAPRAPEKFTAALAASWQSEFRGAVQLEQTVFRGMPKPDRLGHRVCVKCEPESLGPKTRCLLSSSRWHRADLQKQPPSCSPVHPHAAKACTSPCQESQAELHKGEKEALSQEEGYVIQSCL
ncbi:uncharacterized protein LOC105240244 [Ailuropoda melanoleuca]|uniref:uncharacterized protein LOC105240244 n=1 Tax=Ailuropoda melanoleuca TaxID=9646 RepID=UPI0014943DFB|nr:uncharacterized protein LOC105240244 [Ailuropoda melanoleuca]